LVDSFASFASLFYGDTNVYFQITEKAQQLEEELATTKTQLEEAQKELARLRQEFDEKTVEVHLWANALVGPP
jgi:chromosome segregation ATPase